MLVIMYVMIDTFDHVYLNINKVYMALLMTAPMVILEILMMKSMYQKKSLNVSILLASIIISLTVFLFVREQTGVGDVQFLRSMISHHSSAILMCEEAGITDPEIKLLCDSIKAAQIREINEMETILKRLE